MNSISDTHKKIEHGLQKHSVVRAYFLFDIYF